MAADHDAAKHLERGACCGAPLSQPHRQTLESSSEDLGIPPRHKGWGINVYEGFGIGYNRNADYADKFNDRRSVSRTVITLGAAAVSWACSTQRCVTLSTAKAEHVLVALGEGVKEALFTGEVVSFICPELDGSCVRVFEDNQGGIALAENPLSPAQSKHIDVRFHFVRELLRATKIDIQFVASEEQHADILTKDLAANPFQISP